MIKRLNLKIAFGVIAMSLQFTHYGATIDEARQMAENGDIQDAIEMLKTLENELPKDKEVPMLLGDYYVALGADDAAVSAYRTALKKGNHKANLSLAELANTRYEVDDAREYLSAYRSSLKKGKKTLHPDESGDLDQRIDRTENMLARVERIEIIDSLLVDADDFFTYYRLTPESGSINSPEVLPHNFPVADPTIVYEPESRRQMIWAAPDEANHFALYSSSALYGDIWETPTALGDHLGEEGDANYPFLMPDGITLYYANDGENSLGGLDIFISRKSDDGFLQPQNLGMPYNSPYDDYMLAIDELTGVGWWASDRNRIPGKVTIYIFIPNEFRSNVDPDSDNLIALARLNNIKDTWRESTDRNAYIRKIMAISESAAARQPQFELAIPGRGVITRFEQFHTPRAKSAMHQYLEKVKNLAESNTQLEQLRQRYAKGDHSVAEQILQLERELPYQRKELIDLRNEIILYEQ